MSQVITIELSDETYAALQRQAQAAAQSPAKLAAAAVEQHFSTTDAGGVDASALQPTETSAACARFEHHFGTVNLGYATGVDNEGIDADLARAYEDRHEGR